MEGFQETIPILNPSALSSPFASSSSTSCFSLSSSKSAAVTSFHYAFTGFLHFLLGIPLFALTLVMLVVQIGPLTGMYGNIALSKLEEIKIPPNSVTVSSFVGRIMIDAVLVVLLWFFVGRIFLAILIAAVIASVAFFKDREIELFNEVFGQSEAAAPASSPSVYETVES